MPVTPYNTGKIKIGCHYVPQPRNLNTPESDFWQPILLGEKRESMLWWVLLVLGLLVGFGVGYWGFQ